MLSGRWLVTFWLVVLGAVAPATLLAGTTERVSVGSDGEQGNYASGYSAISADGRYVAFTSEASNLVPGDTGSLDVFVRDQQSRTTERVSVSSSGEQGNGMGFVNADPGPTISADGRFVAFCSNASNLVPEDTNGRYDVFVRDRLSGITERVSVDASGAEGDDDSGMSSGVSGLRSRPAISADGRFVAFLSYASNLVPGDTNGRPDVFVHDRLTGATERVSVGSAGEQGSADFYSPAISADGRFVAFCGSAAASIVPGDTNDHADIFVRNRLSGVTERVSVNSSSEQPNGDCAFPAISADGRYVAFCSSATNLVSGGSLGGVFVRDRLLSTTECVSLSASGELGTGWGCSVSADGMLVAFWSIDDLVPDTTRGMSRVYARDRLAGSTELLSLSTWGEQAGSSSDLAQVSGDGRFVVFRSSASNLVSGDTNDVADIFVRDRKGFSDVPFSHWAFRQISACVDANVVKGYDDGTYHPERSVTRDQMAVFIARAMNGGDPTGPATLAFIDIADPWANAYIAYCLEHGVVQGYDSTHYAPTAVVDRGQLAVFVARSMDWVKIDDDMTTAPQLFPDVPAGFWSGTAIKACLDNGVVQGYDEPDGSKTYRPDDRVTRDQMAVYVARAWMLPL